MRRLWLCTLVTAVAAAEAGGQALPATLNVASDARVRIENASGPITVIGWERNEVEASSAGAPRDAVEVSGNSRRVDINAHSGGRLTVRVPVGASVDVRAASGSVRVSGIENTIEIEAASGSVTIEGTPRSITVVALSGSVDVRGGGREITRVEAASGSVRVSEVRGVADLSSSSGSVIAAGSVRDGKIFSVSGTASFSGTVESGGRLSLESSSGNVMLRIPAATSAEYELSTVSGSIRNSFGPRAEHSSEGGVTHRFSVGGGRARIKAASVSGSVHLSEP